MYCILETFLISQLSIFLDEKDEISISKYCTRAFLLYDKVRSTTKYTLYGIQNGLYVLRDLKHNVISHQPTKAKVGSPELWTKRATSSALQSDKPP